MNPSTILLMLLYGGALAFVIYFIVQRYRPTPIIIQQVPVVYSESTWWPWSAGSYNSWPYWTGWWSGGSNGGYNYRGRGGHGGGHGGGGGGRGGGGGGRGGGRGR